MHFVGDAEVHCVGWRHCHPHCKTHYARNCGECLWRYPPARGGPGQLIESHRYAKSCNGEDCQLRYKGYSYLRQYDGNYDCVET